MTTEPENSAPAGVEETAVSEDMTPSILSVDDAAKRWMDSEDRDTAQAETAQTTEPEQGTEEAAAVAAEGEPGTETVETPPEQPDFIDWEQISSDKKMRLRDGFEFDKKFINENIDKIRKLPEIERAISAEMQRVRDAQAQHAQREQFLAQVLPVAIATAQAAVPEEPVPPEFDPSDPVGYMEQQARYQRDVANRNRKLGELQQLKWAQAQQAQASQAQQATQTKAYIDEQRQALFAAIPRLRDEGERQKFVAEYGKLAESLGFSREEYGQAADHRVMKMADLALDGLKYRELKANPPKPKPVALQGTTPPVAEPGKRQSAAEAEGSKRQELLSRMRKNGGSIADAARFVAELDL